MLVFIDESGDPGFKLAKGSSAVFVAAMVAFRKVEVSVQTTDSINGLARRLRINNEFKFSKSRPEIRDAFFAAVLPHDFCIRAIAVKKERIYSAKLREEKESFYNFFVKSMLKFDNGLLTGATVVIDGSGDRDFKNELKAYIRRHIGGDRVSSVRFSNSENDRLIQLADMCAGAIARHFKGDKDDASRWKDMINSKIEDLWEFR